MVGSQAGVHLELGLMDHTELCKKKEQRKLDGRRKTQVWDEGKQRRAVCGVEE